MAVDLKTVNVEPDGEVARILRFAADERILIDTSIARYRVVRETDDPFQDYDPAAVQEALRQSAGAFAGLDIETFKAEIREERAQNSRGRPA
jgi:hypothetical protein